MAKKVHNVSYTHASLCPLNILSEKERKSFPRNGSIRDGNFRRTVGDYGLMVGGVSIPIYALHSIDSSARVLSSMRRIIGDMEPSFERYYKLIEEGIVPEHQVYFDGECELCDYSRADKLEGKQVTQWIEYARKYPGKLERILPGDMGADKRIGLVLTPTFEAMSRMNNIHYHEGEKNERGKGRVKGLTIAGCLDNFVDAYNLVKAHLDWVEIEQRNRHMAELRGEIERTGKYFTPPVSQLVVISSKEE